MLKVTSSLIKKTAVVMNVFILSSALIACSNNTESVSGKGQNTASSTKRIQV